MIKERKMASSDDELQPWLDAMENILSRDAPEPTSLPVEITPWLYLGDLNSILHPSEYVRNLGITHVITANSFLDVSAYKALRDILRELDIENHCIIPGQDNSGYDMIENHWEECRNFIVEANSKRKKILVHCVAGVNRSGLIAAAAVLLVEQKPLLDTVALIKQRRGTVLTNKSFQRQLGRLAANLGLLGPKPSVKRRVKHDMGCVFV